MLSAPVAFALVGLLGFVVQLATLALLTSAGISWLPATVIAVEAAIVQNYFCHGLVTWPQRRGSFVRFNSSMAVTSIGGNVVLMALLVRGFGMPVIAANVIAVGLLSAANFAISDRWVFTAVVCLI